MGLLFFFIFAACIISVVVISVMLSRRWHAWWSVAALLPSIALTVVAINIVAGTLLDKTSHNLWPLELLVWSSGGLIFLGLLYLIRTIKEKLQ